MLENKDNSNKSKIAEREEEIQKYWEENKIFEKTLEKPFDKTKDKGEFVFYDGPPFATGLPHYGSLLGSIIKDVIPRYKTMRGYYVRRRWGWDCHGLPIENMIEKELGLKDKTEIEKIGVKKFNTACRESVLRYTKEWKKFIDRIARWVEYDNAYMTMDSTYTESVWWALKEIHKKGLLYEGRKVLLYCPRCQTPIAKAEVQMDNSYKDITEEAVYVKFKIKNPKERNLPENTFLLAWTTTPWTLPGNVALAVGKDIDYILARPLPEADSTHPSSNASAGREQTEHFVLAKNIFDSSPEAEYGGKMIGNYSYALEAEKNLKSKELIGLEYEPLYEIEAIKNSSKKSHYVSDGDFVTTEEGTGIVHTAVMYGEDDYELGIRLDLPMIPLLDEKGHFTKKAPKIIAEKYFKGAEKIIKEDLGMRGLLFGNPQMNTHSYPHCHRCETELLYNAITSWFINIQKIKDKIIKNNEKVNWVPGHLKHGRFQNIVESAPDWTISRNRYWASPLPIWRSKSGEIEVIGSLEEIKKKTKSSNKYFVMRHGQADSNIKGIVSSEVENEHFLTEVGRGQVDEAVKILREKNIDVIISSPFKRTLSTAQIAGEALGVEVTIDKAIQEIQTGGFNGRPNNEYHAYFSSMEEKFTKTPPGGENLNGLKRRMGDFLYGLDKKYRDKNILIISHEYPLWMLSAVVEGADVKKSASMKTEDDFIKNAEIRGLDFAPIPHNDNYELDFHRPYIDEITWTNGKGEKMERIPEVVDGWVEAASMPFAEYHYPFHNKEDFEKRFPGDFVAEYIAQTRTWFYYMLVISTALFDDIAFRNVLTTGTILAEDGSKMSKSRANYTDPMENISKFSADALRYYLMTNVVMRAEDSRFSDDEIREAQNRFINILLNTFNFYKMYVEDEYDSAQLLLPNSKNVLDKWIISKLHTLNKDVTQNFEEFNTLKSGRAIRDFVTDFSQWYIRRSRDRFKSDDKKDKESAISTTRFVLLELSKLTAPLTPFMAEHIYLGLNGEKESVHLESWPEPQGKLDEEVESLMEETREIVTLALEQRAKVGIKVRQPLAMLKIQNTRFEIQGEEFVSLIKEEVNVKEVELGADISEAVELDIEITPELKEEGMARDFIRQVQSMRKKAGLMPQDSVDLLVYSKGDLSFIDNFEDEIKITAGVKGIKKSAEAKSFDETEELNNFVESQGGRGVNREEIEIGDIRLKIELSPNNSLE